MVDEKNIVIDQSIVAKYATSPAMDAKHCLMVPQEAVRHSVLPEEVLHNAIWDYQISPDGRHYFSVCAEGSLCEYAHLYEYLPKTGELKCLFKFDDRCTTYARAIRASKFHATMSFTPDGKVIMMTHTTAMAPGHPEWLPLAYYDHEWEGFPGTNLITYDPKTDEVVDYGLVLRRDSAYGGAYVAKTNSFYFGTYLRGHMYRYDLTTHRLTDYGQATEIEVFRYIVGPDDNVYFATKTGAFMRMNTEKDCIEDLGVSFPLCPSIKFSLLHNTMTFCDIAPDKKLYIGAAYSERLLRYDFATNELEIVGRYAPEEFRSLDNGGAETMAGLSFDKNGVMWYTYTVGFGTYLCSWDVLGGGEPVSHGLLGSVKRRICCVSEMHIHGDVLYASDSNHSYDPCGIIAVDLEPLRKGAKATEKCMDPLHYLRFANGQELYGGDLSVDGRRFYIKDFLRGEESWKFYEENSNGFKTDIHFLTKTWRQVAIEESAVTRVWYDNAGNVHALCGPDEMHHIVLKEGVVLSIDQDKSAAPALENPAEKFAHVTLPGRPGRQYLNVANAFAPMADGKFLVGTKDAMLAVVDGDSVFSLGICAQHGPIHQMVSTKDGKTVYGVAGDPEDVGMVFSFSFETGLVLHGRIYVKSGKSIGGLGVSCEPCCLALSDDDKWLVIGARDRMGCVYEYDLSSGIVPLPIT